MISLLFEKYVTIYFWEFYKYKVFGNTECKKQLQK